MVLTSTRAAFARRRCGTGASAGVVRIHTAPARVHRWSRSRRRLAGSLTASLLVHGSTLAMAWWLGQSGYFSARPLETAEGRSSIALIASLAAAEAVRQETPVEQSVAVLASRSLLARVERPLGSPQPRVEAAARRSDLATPQPHVLPAAPDLKPADDVSLTDMQPAIALGGSAGGDAALAQQTQTGRTSELPRQQTVATIDSSASVPSPASAASTGAANARPARIVFNPAPAYPPDALAARRTGRVMVRVTVTVQGTVKNVRLHRSSGVASLDAAALAAVRNWRFQPALLDGVPVERDLAVPVRFTLADQ